MANLTWGKPTVEIAPYVNGALPAVPTWTALPDLRQDSAKLTPTKGTKLEAIAEGGDTIDVKYQKNKFSFDCEVFVQKDAVKPITDVDGVIDTNYAIRLTPEDNTLTGWQLDKTYVTVETSWTSKDGTMLKYSFEGLKPAAGGILKEYTA